MLQTRVSLFTDLLLESMLYVCISRKRTQRGLLCFVSDFVSSLSIIFYKNNEEGGLLFTVRACVRACVSVPCVRVRGVCFLLLCVRGVCVGGGGEGFKSSQRTKLQRV